MERGIKNEALDWGFVATKYSEQSERKYFIYWPINATNQKKPNEGGMHSNSFIDKYFGGIFKVEMKCRESEDEPPVYSTENFLQLSCFISAGIWSFKIIFN